MVGHHLTYSRDGRELVANFFHETHRFRHKTHIHAQTHTEQHPYFTNSIYYLCRAQDDTSTYAKPHMKRNTGHTQARVCVDCVGKDTHILLLPQKHKYNPHPNVSLP